MESKKTNVNKYYWMLLITIIVVVVSICIIIFSNKPNCYEERVILEQQNISKFYICPDGCLTVNVTNSTGGEQLLFFENDKILLEYNVGEEFVLTWCWIDGTNAYRIRQVSDEGGYI